MILLLFSLCRGVTYNIVSLRNWTRKESRSCFVRMSGASNFTSVVIYVVVALYPWYKVQRNRKHRVFHPINISSVNKVIFFSRLVNRTGR